MVLGANKITTRFQHVFGLILVLVSVLGINSQLAVGKSQATGSPLHPQHQILIDWSLNLSCMSSKAHTLHQ